jgi:hypothetical protein
MKGLFGMTMGFTRKLCLLTFSLAAAATLPVSADFLYNNSTTDLKYRFNPGIAEVGDEITLAAPGFLTNFSFEYYGVGGGPDGAAFAGNIQARVTFYNMDGPLLNGYVTPGTPFWTSDLFSVSAPTTRETFVFNSELPANFLLPQNFTWSVQFTGQGTGDEVGLDIYGPPTVGSSMPDYWDKSTGSWVVKRDPGVVTPINFASRFEGTIPEPSTATLLVAGSLSALLIARRRRG